MDNNADFTGTISQLEERIKLLIEKQRVTHPRKRILIALAGVPGSGKSTVSHALLNSLSKDGFNDIAILPMDGFHHTKATLSSFDDPTLAFRKRGAPFTFDVERFLEQVHSLSADPVATDDEPEAFIEAPGFDHAVGDPVPGAIRISSACRVVIIEGNYTLLDESPWNEVAGSVDEKWFVDIDPDVAKERLARRHLSAGIEKTFAGAIARAEDNDLPNGNLIRSKLINPDVRVVS